MATLAICITEVHVGGHCNHLIVGSWHSCCALWYLLLHCHNDNYSMRCFKRRWQTCSCSSRADVTHPSN